MTSISFPSAFDIMSYLKEVCYVDALLSFVVWRARFMLRLTSPTAFGVHILY